MQSQRMAERPAPKTKQIFAHTALTSDGWKNDVLVTIDDAGVIADVTASCEPSSDAHKVDILLPGMSNVHSHAFQRAMAGLTEIAGNSNEDNFWSWRQVMYHFKQKLTPEYVQIIAQHLYIELLKSGYTAVGEFHYIHHNADGTPYDNPAELSLRIIEAASNSGIHLTLLPVYYESANFGGKPADDGQKRFIHSIDDYLNLLELLSGKQHDLMHLGIAPHSLRAVPQASLSAILDALTDLKLTECPKHIHVSEQMKEVEDCLSWSQKRPIEWLMDHAPIDSSWCFIHATHANDNEIKAMASKKLVAGLCPTTEANLGDGIFKHQNYMANHGLFGIGSDSNMCVSPFEELKQMEYAQRLITRSRNVLSDRDISSTGYFLYANAATGGAQALGINCGSIAKHMRADMIAFDSNHPILANKKAEYILDSLIFALPAHPVSHSWVAGTLVIDDGYHPLEEQTAKRYSNMISELMY